jgi:3-oxoacyl-[acyl-carrier-protein] synthase-3
MSQIPLYLHALGHFHPDNVIDNRFLQELDIGTTDEWILERVGIRERRTVLPLDYIRSTRNADVRAGQEAALYSNVETGKRAATMAIERAGLRAKDIGMVIAGGCCPDMAIPSEACRLAAALDIDVAAVDINSACSTFGAHLHLLASMRELPPYVLCVSPENTTRTVNYADRATSVLWGDGASAAIVSLQAPARARIVETSLGSSPAGWMQVTIPRFGHFAQEGSAVQRFAIKTTLALVEAMLPAARARLAETGGALHFVGHQANLLVLEAVTRRARITDDEHWHNVVDRGNTGAAGAPTVLSQRWGELKRGDVVILAVVGSGLTWSSLRIEID